MKLPAFQFYPGDWRKDPGVQSLDYQSRGVWLEILCLMHESERRGVLLLNGKAMPESALARLLGIEPNLLNQILTTLDNHGVTSREAETGALMSRRMVRDESLRKIRQTCGKKGGNPVLLNQIPTTGDNQISTPSSSSSSSPSVEEREGVCIPPMTRQELDRLAEMRGVPKECVEWFWNTHDARGWTDATGQPIRKVEPMLMNALQKWRAKPQAYGALKPRNRGPNI